MVCRSCSCLMRLVSDIDAYAQTLLPHLNSVPPASIPRSPSFDPKSNVSIPEGPTHSPSDAKSEIPGEVPISTDSRTPTTPARSLHFQNSWSAPHVL